jgi:hypothetical protein
MKKYVIRMVALLIFTSMAISSCSVEYRQRHMHHDDHHYDEVHHN